MKKYLHNIPTIAENETSPLQFTYPFCYEPHPLCVAAAEEVKKDLKLRFPSLQTSGKMFGVLVVDTPEGRKYISAFSGILEGSYHHEGFVPPILDIQDPDGYFRKEEIEISKINTTIKSLNIDNDKDQIEALKEERKHRSIALQTWTFAHFEMLNALGVKKDLLEIFKDYKAPLTAEQYKQKAKPTIGIPPAGAGECCAPKLFQIAFIAKWKPVCMAEFWIGPSPKEEIRIEGNYYPSCNNKCKPILSHMLIGLDVEESPIIARNRAVAKDMKVIYSDKDIAVICKPSGMLSVPGKEEAPSVLGVIQEMYPDATGPIIVHRLDMDTSGIMVTALNEDAYKNLQQQFIKHTARKKYIAIIEKTEKVKSMPTTGTIDLPLCPNPFDRPRQIVNYEHGKRAITRYEILGETDKGIRIAYWPETGRTHQLRVHSAHPDGMGSPIIGDNLYGIASDRLYLHAEELTLIHPSSGETKTFKIEMI